MANRFLIYIPNPPSISTLTSSGTQTKWNTIKNNLAKVLENYKNNEYYLQELELFDFIDQPFNGMSNSHFHKIIKKLMDKLKEEIKEYNLKAEPISFNKEDKTIFNLTFKNLYCLVNIMMYLLEYTTSKGKTSDIVYEFAFKNKVPKIKDVLIHKQQLSKVLSNLQSIQTIKISLYKENEDIYNNKKNKKNSIFRMDPKIVFFFSLFYKSIFKSITSAIIDLNIPPIDNYFINNSNPYLINEEKILYLADYYKDIFICNLILVKSLPELICISSLHFEMYDSYQLELHKILSVLFKEEEEDESDSNKQKLINSKTIIPKNNDVKDDNLTVIKDNPIIYSPKFNNNYLYIQHILNSSETKFFEFCLDFNSLDPLLFDSVNFLLTKFICISQLSLKLFPNKKINKRKIYLNNCAYKKYSDNYDETLHLYSNEDKKIYYQYLEKNDNNSNNFILKDEKLLNELFFSFKTNLNNLSFILEKKINDLLTLSIDFSTFNNESISLFNYDNYNCSIICFIFNLFRAFQSQIDKCKINSLEIFYDDFLDEKTYVVETIRKKIPSCKNGFKLHNLQLNHINFNISNISLILPFENFPSVNLTELILSNLSYNDLNNLVGAFQNNKDVFPVLIILNLSIGIMVENYKKPLERLLRECLPSKLTYFSLSFPFNVSISDLVDTLYWIKCNHNTERNINIKMCNSKLSQCINNSYYFKNCVIDLFKLSKDYFKQRNILLNYDINDDHSIKFILNKYKDKDIDYYYNLIYCFNKTNSLNINISNQKIFENIFNYRGKFKKYEIKVEIIN